MSVLPSLLLAGLLQAGSAQDTLEAIRQAVGSGNRARVEAQFARKEDAAYLFEMAERRGGLRRIEVSMIPAPPGWEKTGPYWAVFHARHDLQEDHDPVHSVIRTGDGLKIGKEVPEWTPQSARLKHLRADARIVPDRSRAEIASHVALQPWSGTGAILFRLNKNYVLRSAEADGKTLRVVRAGETVPSAQAGDAVQAGGLIVLWSAQAPTQVSLRYDGVVRSETEDKVAPHVAYLTGWWTPSIARLPHTSAVRVRTPKEWHGVSEGFPCSAEEAGFEPLAAQPDEAVRVFRNPLPISYPKIVAGQYKLAAEGKDAKGRLFRSYHLDPVEPKRAERDVQLMIEGTAFFERHFGEFPFPGYDCYDADTYYGIESYSYTLLRRSITTTFVTHEIAHTYFGGLAPSAYVRDSWNEGITQYVDSVVFGNNRDGTLQNALRTMNVAVPLSQMAVPHAFNSATYWRGAYAMKMLEAEIGREAILAALREIVKDRVGQDTVWASLRPYFERAGGGKDLGWFWSQWIERAEFPSLRIVSAQLVPREGKFSTFVTVSQTGTYAPYRLRFRVKLRSSAGELASKEVELLGNRDSFRLDTDSRPTEASLDVFGLALATAGPPAPVRP
jgi:hypothetical protein